MSDTFDHEGDAWESYDRAFDDGYRLPNRRSIISRTPTNFRKPPKYTAVPVVSHIHSTEKAHLVVLTIDGGNHERWVPKSKTVFRFADVIELDDWLLGEIRKSLKEGKNNA